MKHLILGGPRTGKTTLARQLGAVEHLDDYKSFGWHEQSEIASRLMARKDWVMEGTTGERALRKFMDQNPKARLDDLTITRLSTPREPLSPGQQAMLKGQEKVWGEVKGEVLRRGARVVER